MEDEQQPVPEPEPANAKPKGRGQAWAKGISKPVPHGLTQQRETKFLRDMRHVYNGTKETDKGQGQKTLRKMFEDNPTKFLQLLRQEEKANREEKQNKREAVKEKKVDEGTELCLRIVEGLIDGAREKGEW